MNEYIVEITDTAYADLEDMYNYIAYVLQSQENALSIFNRITEAILSLNAFPYRNGLFASEPERSLGIHKMIVDNYVICYVIDPAVVTVTDILYGASDIHTRLEKRHDL